MTADQPLPRRLTAPAPGWTAQADVVVVGSGVAGLSTALHARRAGSVLLVTKGDLDDGSTRWAQGGIAAALGVGDSPDEHMCDTLVAGAGICDEAAVRVLVEQGPGAVRDLITRGARFDHDPDGGIALTREGGHLRDRIAHAGGDATGAEVSRALVEAVRAEPAIEVIEHALVLDLSLDGSGRVCGLTLHVMGEGSRDGVGAVSARAVVLAAGGFGQVFTATTNPAVSTGDGVAIALRAGAAVADMEFTQFHPTVLWLGPDARGQQPLVSEAVRGEGAVLRDHDGVRFMADAHPLADLAPRDIVAKAITRRMRETGADHVFLDGRDFGAKLWERRFPTVLANCRAHGIDPVTELIPVVPAAHYVSGGVRADTNGRTSVPGLYACGEVACTGVHGANRLASNSLLEGMVFAARIGADLARGLPPRGEVARSGPHAPQARRSGLLRPELRGAIRRATTAGAGVLRSHAGLTAAAEQLRAMRDQVSGDPCVEAWEATNMHLVASTLTAAALARTETRGCHWREDFPASDDAWLGHLIARLDAGEIHLAFEKKE